MNAEFENALIDPEKFAKNFILKISRANRSVRDVFFLNTVFLWKRGRKERAKTKQSLEAEELIAHLMSVYEIQADNDLDLQEDTVTLERIHFAFPSIGCKAAAVGVEQRKATSQLNKVMAIIECPAFARYCTSLLQTKDRDCALFVDAHCWSQYLIASKWTNAPDMNIILNKTLQWQADFTLEELAVTFEEKLGMFVEIEDLMNEESNVKLGIAELHKFLRNAACIPNVYFIVDQAIHERTNFPTIGGECSETFLNNYEILHFSGSLLCYLTLIKKQLCRASKISSWIFKEKRHFPELRIVLKEAAIALLRSTPEQIEKSMRTVGLRITWNGLIHAAHVKVRPLLRNLLAIDMPPVMTRRIMAELGLRSMFTKSVVFKGFYPNLIREWAMEWRRVMAAAES